MSWRDRLLPASLRGVRFWVESDSRAGGRRVALHQYPLRDKPYAEDLGRQARRYSVEAILVGPDYDLELITLQDALERSGAALLSHPTYGLLSVAVVGYRTTLSTAEGGLARVSMDLVEAGENAFPLSVADSLGGVVTGASDLIDTARSAFNTAYTVAGYASLVGDAAVALVGAYLAPLGALAGTLGMSSADQADYAAGLGSAQRDLTFLVSSPALTGAAIADATTPLRTLAGAPWPAYQALRPLAEWDEGETIPETTLARVQQAANQTAIVGLVRDCALANACAAALSAIADGADAAAVATLAAGIPATQNEITALRDELLGLIDARQAEASDALYQAWATLRARVARDLSQRALAAPRLRTVTPDATGPALAIAYRLHGDAARAEEIIRRNRIRHPGFVPGGLPLEVLSA